MTAPVTVPAVLPEPRRHRAYTGSVDHYSGLLRSAAEGLHLEACGIRRRIRDEDAAADIVASHIPTIERAMELLQASLAEIKQALAEQEEQRRAA